MIGLTIAQYSFYYLLSISDYIDFIFLIILFFWLCCFLIELFFIYTLVRYGMPTIIYDAEQCHFQYLKIQLSISYQNITSLTLTKVENRHRSFSTGFDYELELDLKEKINEQNLFRKMKQRSNDLKITASPFYRNDQILKASLILSLLRRRSPNKRNEILEQLNQKNFNYEKLISREELENFKNNQYISKSFKSGQ